jgi:uncharacterized surface anchored protein
LIAVALMSISLEVQIQAQAVVARTTAGKSTTAASAFYRIAGIVVNAGSGEPIRHAAVAVLSEEESETLAAVESDNEGRFTIGQLPAGKYQLTASKRGFLTAFYDEHEGYNTAIVTGPGQDTEKLKFRLVPGAVLHGVVTAEGGDPVEGAKVMLFAKPHGKMSSEHSAQQDVTTTDDTGAYEFTNLAAGDYLIAVSAEPWYALHHSADRARKKQAAGEDSSAALDVSYPITFFDSTTEEAAATAITLTGGGREEANIGLHALPSLRVVVETPRKQDGGIARAELRQMVFGTMVSAVSAGFMDAMQTGTTEFDGVSPGHYELVQGDQPRVAELDVASNLQVDSELGVPAVSVSGTLRSVSGIPLPDQVALTLESIDTGRFQDSIESPGIRGGFNFATVPAGNWKLSAAGAGKPLAVASITVNGHTHIGNLLTVNDRPLSLVVNIGIQETRVEGFARRNSKGVAGAMMVLVPKDLAALRGLARRDQSDSDGSFSLRDVTPGQYMLVAIEDGWEIDWEDPAVIGRYLPRGIAVTVSDTSGKTITLSEPVPVQTRQ